MDRVSRQDYVLAEASYAVVYMHPICVLVFSSKPSSKIAHECLGNDGMSDPELTLFGACGGGSQMSRNEQWSRMKVCKEATAWQPRT